MKRSVRGRESAGRRRDAEEWLAIARDVRASGQSVKAYASRHGYVANTLAWWCSELGRRERTDPVTRVAERSSAFVPVVVKGAPPVGADPILVEMGKVVVRLPCSYSPASLAELIVHLAGGAAC